MNGRREKDPLAKQIEVGPTEHLALQHLDLVVVVLGRARAVAQAEPGDHGIEVLAEAVDEALKDGQVVRLDASILWPRPQP